MEWLLASLINFLMALLESAFAKKPNLHNDDDKFPPRNESRNGNNREGKDGNNSNDENHFYHDRDRQGSSNNNNTDRMDKTVEQAYEFLELTPPCESLDQLKKQYKKLSLKYHPDRSTGSHDLMTKLNACRSIVENDWKKRQSSGGDDNDDENDDNNSFNSEQARQEMEKAWEEELERQRKEHEQFQRQKKHQKQECHKKQRAKGLQSQTGREEAHQEFVEQVAKVKQQQQQQQQQQEQKGDANESSDSNPTKTPKKPQNYVMEYNADDVATALRLGKEDIAMGILEERLNYHLQTRQIEAQLTGDRSLTMNQVGLEFLNKPLDLDGNAILHYAIYFESYSIMNAACGMAHKFKGLEAVLEQRNEYGQSPEFFCQIAQNDAIPRLFQAQMELLHTLQSKTHVLPAMRKAWKQLVHIMIHVDVIGALCILAFWYLGSTWGLHPVTNIVAIVFVQFLGRMSEDNDLDHMLEYQRGIMDVTLFMSFCALWIGIRVSFAWILRVVMVEFLLLLSPFAVAVLVNRSYYRRRRRGGGILGVLLLPLELQASLAGYMERGLNQACRSLASLTNTEQLLTSGKGGRWAKPILLALILIGNKGIGYSLG